MCKEVRCAIYTRKSNEDGLEQKFNSLDAQRVACEKYIKSREGWITLAKKLFIPLLSASSVHFSHNSCTFFRNSPSLAYDCGFIPVPIELLTIHQSSNHYSYSNVSRSCSGVASKYHRRAESCSSKAT